MGEEEGHAFNVERLACLLHDDRVVHVEAVGGLPRTAGCGRVATDQFDSPSRHLQSIDDGDNRSTSVHHRVLACGAWERHRDEDADEFRSASVSTASVAETRVVSVGEASHVDTLAVVVVPPRIASGQRRSREVSERPADVLRPLPPAVASEVEGFRPRPACPIGVASGARRAFARPDTAIDRDTHGVFDGVIDANGYLVGSSFADVKHGHRIDASGWIRAGVLRRVSSLLPTRDAYAPRPCHATRRLPPLRRGGCR